MAPQHHLMLDPEILAAVVRTRIDHRCRPGTKRGARHPIAPLRPDNPFLLPTPPELHPWRKLPQKRRPRRDRKTTMIAAIVWAVMMGFVAVAYALHAPISGFPTP